MKRYPVSSTSLKSVGYDPETRTLEIEFQSGEVYQYSEVLLDEYTGLMHSDSLGQYFISHIRDRYQYVRVTHH